MDFNGFRSYMASNLYEMIIPQISKFLYQKNIYSCIKTHETTPLFSIVLQGKAGFFHTLQLEQLECVKYWKYIPFYFKQLYTDCELFYQMHSYCSQMKNFKSHWLCGYTTALPSSYTHSPLTKDACFSTILDKTITFLLKLIFCPGIHHKCFLCVHSVVSNSLRPYGL